MKVVILCGGKGTRIADAGYDAKALVPVGPRPILWHIMKIYAQYDYQEFVLTLGHGASAIKQYFMSFGPMTRDFTLSLTEDPEFEFHEQHPEDGWQVTMANTGLETNKGSRVAQVLKYTNGKAFHLTYGDGLGNINLDALHMFHRAHGRLVTITGYQPYSQYGLLNLSDNDEIIGFEEKPRLDQWINAGFMICEPGIEAYLTDDPNLDLEREVFMKLAEDNQLMVYKHHGFWRSMDTFKEAQELSKLWQDGAPWNTWDY